MLILIVFKLAYSHFVSFIFCKKFKAAANYVGGFEWLTMEEEHVMHV